MYAMMKRMVVGGQVLKGLGQGERVPLQYYVFGERHRRKTVILHIDHSWCCSRPSLMNNRLMCVFV